MNSAVFLLVVNAAIGLSFAGAFKSLARGSHRRLATLCAWGFFAASGVAFVEIIAPLHGWHRLTSFLSFGLLMLALTIIVEGLAGHCPSRRDHRWIWLLLVASLVLHQALIYDLPRDSTAHAYAYQAPFALISGTGAVILLRSARSDGPEWFTGVVLAASSVQFIAKAYLADAITTGSSVSSYVLSTYAQYSQTAGAVHSCLQASG